MLPVQIVRNGSPQPPAPTIQLRAGPLALALQDGDLRYIRLGSQEILRRVYVAVRDHNWDTVPAQRSNLQIDSQADRFLVTYDAEHQQGSLHFAWAARIEGDGDGRLCFRMQGRALSTFRRCRIGFCLLHPIEYAGARCRVEHVDGSIDQACFPQYIAPQLVRDGHACPVQPFVDMKALSHQVDGGLWVQMHFEGERFELEDQRNWTDASYKTYGTPLALPFAVEVVEGTEVSQTVTMSLRGTPGVSESHVAPVVSAISAGDPPARPATDDTPAQRSLNDTRTQPILCVTQDVLGPVAPLGLERPESTAPWTARQLQRLQQLRLCHLRTEVWLSRQGWQDHLQQAWDDARQLDADLEVALFLGQDCGTQLRHLAALLQQTRPSVSAWLVFHEGEPTTGPEWVNLVRKHLRGVTGQAPIGSGTNAFFTDLNRGEPATAVSDVISYSLNPQVHAFDDASVMETLEAQAHTIRSARRLCGDTPLRISPITFRMRFIPHISGPQPEPLPGELPFQVDPRQMSLFGAAWTVGSLRQTLGSGLHGVTYYETIGWRGVMEREQGSALAPKFASIPDAVFPLYHVLADVGEVRDGEVLHMTTSDALAADALAIRHDGGLRILVANLRGEPQQVEVQLAAEAVIARFLDETHAEEAMVQPEAFRATGGECLRVAAGCLPLTLRPYAVARLDVEDGLSPDRRTQRHLRRIAPVVSCHPLCGVGRVECRPSPRELSGFFRGSRMAHRSSPLTCG